MALKLAYETWGEGKHPLLLLHGFTGIGPRSITCARC
jgi:hypothetical protein